MTAPSQPSVSAAAGGARRFAILLGVIAALALAIRLLNVLEWRPTASEELQFGGVVSESGVEVEEVPGGYYLGGDAIIYHYQGRALAEGNGLLDPGPWLFRDEVRPSAQRPPAYSAYLGLWSALGVRSVTGHRVVSGLLGVATVVVLGLAGRTLVGTRTGLIAAGIAAIYPGMWINDGMLLSEPISQLGVALYLWATYHLIRHPTGRATLLAGLAGGFVALTRNELLLLFPLGVVPVLLSRAHLARTNGWSPDVAPTARAQRAGAGLLIRLRAGWRPVLASAAVAGLFVVPWIARNLVSFEEPVLTSSQTGAVLSAGACDDVFYGERIGMYANCFQDFPSAEELVALDESEIDVFPREAALEYIGDNLRQFPLVVAARIGRVWAVFKPFHTTRTLDIAVESRGHNASWLGLFGYYVLVPFAVVGVLALRRQKVPVTPILALVVTVTLAAAMTFANTRYRAPAEVALVLAAAVGIDLSLRLFQARARARAQPGDGG